jgi:tRNA modification GTPase
LDHYTESYLEDFKQRLSDKNYLLVFNKSDERSPVESYDCVVSAKSGEGVGDLKNIIFKSIQGYKTDSKKTFVIRDRHLGLFKTALSLLESCIDKISNNQDVDVAAEDLRLIRSSFDEFLGIKYPDDLLGDIFKDFCIGK